MSPKCLLQALMRLELGGTPPNARVSRLAMIPTGIQHGIAARRTLAGVMRQPLTLWSANG